MVVVVVRNLCRSFVLGFGFCYEDTWKDAAAGDMLILSLFLTFLLSLLLTLPKLIILCI